MNKELITAVAKSILCANSPLDKDICWDTEGETGRKESLKEARAAIRAIKEAGYAVAPTKAVPGMANEAVSASKFNWMGPGNCEKNWTSQGMFELAYMYMIKAIKSRK